MGAERGGEPIGTARYVCLDDRPGVAEIAVTIADGWHEHGVGTALLDVLAERAVEEGVERFLAICLPSNLGDDRHDPEARRGPGRRPA